MESVILSSPILMVGYGLAILFCLFDLFKHATGFVFPIISLVLCTATTVAALVMGASLQEAAIAVMIFAALNLTVYLGHKGKGGKK